MKDLTTNQTTSIPLRSEFDFIENEPYERGFRSFFQANIASDLKNLEVVHAKNKELVLSRLKIYLPFFLFALLLWITQPAFINHHYTTINKSYNDWFNSLHGFYTIFIPSKLIIWNFKPFTLVLLIISSLTLVWCLAPAIRFREDNPQNFLLYSIAKFVFDKETKYTNDYDLSALLRSDLIPPHDHSILEGAIQTKLVDKNLSIEIIELKNDRLTKSISPIKFNYIFNGLALALKYKDASEDQLAIFSNSPNRFTSKAFLKARFAGLLKIEEKSLPPLAAKWQVFCTSKDATKPVLENEKVIDIFNRLTESLDLSRFGRFKNLDNSQIYDKVLLEITGSNIYVLLPLKSNIFNFWSFFKKPDYEKDLHYMLLQISLVKELLTRLI
jgi:hypothetical protein